MNELTQTSELDRAFIKQIAFEVDDGFTKTLPQAIVANFDEVRAFISEQTENDRNVVVSADAIDSFKKRKSVLSKQRDAINAQKIEVHKLWDEPYKDFEDKCKELLKIFDEAIANIDGQLKDFENAEKNAKREELEKYWSETAADVLKYRSYDKIENLKWLNKSVKKDAAKAEMDKIADAVRQDVEVIKALKSENENVLFALYERGATVSEILKVKDGAEKQTTPKTPHFAPKAESVEADADEGDEIAINMTVTTTAAKFALIRAFFKDNEIKYKKLEI